MNERKSDPKKKRKTVKTKVKLSHVNKKIDSEKANLCLSLTFFHSTLKLERQIFTLSYDNTKTNSEKANFCFSLSFSHSNLKLWRKFFTRQNRSLFCPFPVSS